MAGDMHARAHLIQKGLPRASGSDNKLILVRIFDNIVDH